MSDEESELAAFLAPPAAKTGVEAILDKFGNAEDVGNLEYKELCPELLAEYERVCARLNALTDIKAMLRANILSAAKDQPGTYARGEWVAVLKSKSGRVDIDWEEWAADVVGEKEVKELFAIRDQVKKGVAGSKYITMGKNSISVDVSKTDAK